MKTEIILLKEVYNEMKKKIAARAEPKCTYKDETTSTVTLSVEYQRPQDLYYLGIFIASTARNPFKPTF